MSSQDPPILQDERALFMQMAAGSESAFTDIFFFYIPLLQPHILSMTRSEDATQDIIHDVFLKIWLNREQMTEVENYRGYIFTMATNKTYDWMRKLAKERVLLHSTELYQQMNESVNSTEETFDFNQSLAIINQAVATLPAQRKLVFQLSREEGLNHEQIAARLNISKNTVSNHLTEALRSIKEYLKKMPGNSATSILAIVIMSRILHP